VSALGAFDRAIELARAGRSTNRRSQFLCWQVRRFPSLPDAQRAQRTRLAGDGC
jgi:hypothetical protein